MTSPNDETATYAAARPFEAPRAPQTADVQSGKDFGPDEERLVAMARAEAMLRLARAL